MCCILRYGAISTTIGRLRNRRMFAPDITLRAANPRIATAKNNKSSRENLSRRRCLRFWVPHPPHLRVGILVMYTRQFSSRAPTKIPSLCRIPPTIPNSSTTHQSAPSSPHPSKSHPATAAQIPPSPTSASHQSPSSIQNPVSAKHDPAYPPAPD
jgi:hypothetical protein